MTNRSSGQELLRPWKTPIEGIRPIGNLNVHTCGIRSIEIALLDLTQHVMHIFLSEGVLVLALKMFSVGAFRKYLFSERIKMDSRDVTPTPNLPLI